MVKVLVIISVHMHEFKFLHIFKFNIIDLFPYLNVYCCIYPVNAYFIVNEKF